MAKRQLFRNSERLASAQQHRLSHQHLFSQYMLQGQMHEQTFMAMLSAFQGELQRLSKRSMSLEKRLASLRELRQQFEGCLAELQRQQQLQLSAPMRLALGLARGQWFWHYQGPQIRWGWQQAALGFRHLSGPR